MGVDEEPWFKTWMAWRSRPKKTSSEVSRPVQETYKDMIKELISPALRDMGFRGSGGRYYLPSDEHWALLGFQKSAYSDALEIQFTVNVAVVTKTDWASLRESEPFHPEKPSAQLGTSKAGQGERIGLLYPDEPGDRWWPLKSDSDADDVAREVLFAIHEYALPWMRERM